MSRIAVLRVSGAALTTETGVNGKRAASQVLEEPTYWELAQIVLLRTVRLSKHPFATGGMRRMHHMWDKTPAKKEGVLVAKQPFADAESGPDGSEKLSIQTKSLLL